MRRVEAVKIERRLKAQGVYRPYVTMNESTGTMEVDSYPLTARLKAGAFNSELGPSQSITITDCTLPDGNQTITAFNIYIGQDALSTIGQQLIDFHQVAYARATEQGKTGTLAHVRASVLTPAEVAK